MYANVNRLVLLLLLAIVPGLAAAEAQDPARLIETTFERSVSAVQERQAEIRENPRVAYELMETILAPNIDFELMSRLILARHWTGAEPQQRKAFVAAFRESLLRTYSRILSDHIDVVVGAVGSERRLIRVLGTDGPDSRGRVVVRTRLSFEELDIPMDYRMYQRDGQWRVFDVSIEYISFVMNYRSEYDAELQRADLAALTTRLNERNARAWGRD